VFLFFINLAFIFAQSAHVNKNLALNEYTLTEDIEWAIPDGQSLTMDIYTPQTGKTNYPVLVIYHGGGWLINTNAIMDSMAVYMVQHSEIVVCNVNFRLLGDQNNTVTMNQIIEDAMGALAWIKEHISTYGGDSTQIILTGDSSGGHMAAMVLLAGDKLESDGFDGDSFGYNPTYLPEGKTAEDLAAENGLEVQGAVLNYAAFDMYAACLNGFETYSNIFWYLAGKTPHGIFGNDINVNDNPEYYKAVSPIYRIPDSSERMLPPQFCFIGSNDNTVTPASVQEYVDSTLQAGQKAEFWLYEGQPHAFLDSNPNSYLGTDFTSDAPPALDKIIEFIDTNILFTGLENHDKTGKMNFSLYQNYPNPFNPATTIGYSLEKTGKVELKIYDVLGREVSVLVDLEQQPGSYQVRYNGASIPSGVYYYRLLIENKFSETRKMILLR